MQMPNLDGLAAARTIRAREPSGERVPIVAVTANLLEEDRKRCMEAGMDDYFAKPFTPAALIEKVGRWIDR
jgi:CheY-like chemotaxis protein